MVTTEGSIPTEAPLLAWPGVGVATLEAAIENAGMVALVLPAGAEAGEDSSYRTTLVSRIAGTTQALWPAWLPEAEGIDRAGGSGAEAVAILARRRAASSDAFGPYLEAMALAALRGGPAPAGFPLETVADECHKLILGAYGVRQAVIVMDIGTGLDPRCRAIVQDAVQWLAGRARFSVWLVGADLSGFDRVPVASGAAAGVSTRTTEPPRLREPTITPLSGRPSATSPTELRLEDYLAQCGWAHGRAWNKGWSDSVLANHIRVDLMWEVERVVVELDGPDHLAADKYAADRVRDRTLMANGYTVLRFTNAEIEIDIERVGIEIERFLAQSRVVGDEEGSDGLRHT